MTITPLTRQALAVAAMALSFITAFAETNSATAVVRPANYKPLKGNPVAGEALFRDTKLSTNGMACATCHANHGAFSATFAKPYPHTVAMARDQLGRKRIYLDEMVQACMVMPMAAKPLPWGSKELADLTAYVAELQKSFKPAS